MDTVIQISAIIITVALIVLIYFVVQTMRALKGTLEETRLTIEQVRTEVASLSQEIKITLSNTNSMSADIKHKLQSLNTTFAVIDDISQTAHTFTHAMKQSVTQVAASVQTRQNRKVLDQVAGHEQKRTDTPLSSLLMDGIVAGLSIYKRLKR